MTNKLQIPLDSLKNDNVYKLEKEISFDELNITEEKELKFTKPFSIKGKAYLVNDNLILTVNIKFFIKIPCAICNEFVEKELSIKNLHITEKVEKITETYDFTEEIRNACFLEIPSYIQCSDNCPGINNLKNYLNVSKGYFPFSKL